MLALNAGSSDNPVGSVIEKINQSLLRFQNSSGNKDDIAC